MESIIPFARTAMEALAQSWSFNSPTTDSTTNTCSPGMEQGNGVQDHGVSEGDVENMKTTSNSQNSSGPITGDKLPRLPSQMNQAQPDGAMPSATLEVQNTSESENDISTVIRKRKRTRPDGVRKDTGSQNPASNVSSNKPLSISSETPFTKVTDNSKNTWSSFIVGNFLHEVRKDDTPEIDTPSPQESHVLHRGDGPIGGHRQGPATTKSRQKRLMVAEGNTETRDSRRGRTSPSRESRNKKRKLDRPNDRTVGAIQHRNYTDRQTLFVGPESSRNKELHHNIPSRSNLQPEQSPTGTPNHIVSRETFKAIKYTPITAEAKARQRLIDIKPGRAPERTDEELFKFFEAKQPIQRRNQIVEGLLGPERQREAVDNGFSYPPTTSTRNRARPLNGSQSVGGVQKQPAPQPRLNIPKKQNIILPKPKAQTQLSTKDSTVKNPKPSQPGPSKIPVHSVSPEPTNASPPPVPPPIQTVSAEDFLGGPERLVRQWVVYRTQRFPPLKTLETGQVITVDKQKRKIRCSTHISKRAANEAAAARHERFHKDVVRKSWSLTGFGKGLFEGLLKYGAGDGTGEGDVMNFWVEEEITDLAKVTEKWNSDGKKLLLDLQKATFYARKRYDVCSILVYPAPGSPEGSRRQNLIVDCGELGDEDEEKKMDGGDDIDDGGEKGEIDGLETRRTNNSDLKEGQEVSGQSPGSSTGSSETLTGGDTSGNQQSAIMKSANMETSFSTTTTLVGEEAIVGTGPGLTINITNDTINPQTPSDDINTDANMGSCQTSIAEEAPIIASAGISTKIGTEISVNIETSTQVESDDSQKKQQRTPEVDATEDSSQSPSPPPTPRPHPKVKPPINPFTIILPPRPALHGSYTTPQAANVAGLEAFLNLTKPKNARIEDHHFYKHFLAPQMQEQFWDEHKADPDAPVRLQWDATDALEDGCRWEFLHIEVQVVEAELEGVVDLGGMEVDGGPPVDVKGKGKEKEVERDLPAVMEEEDESDISEAE